MSLRPTSPFAFVNTALQTGGTIFDAISRVQEGTARAQMAEYRATVAENDIKQLRQISAFNEKSIENQAASDLQAIGIQSKLLDQDAKAITDRKNARRTFMKGEAERILSTQKAATAGSGITQSGSALEIMAESAANLEMAMIEEEKQFRNQQNTVLLQQKNLEQQSFLTKEKSRVAKGLNKRNTALQTQRLRTQASLERFQGQQSRRSGVRSAFGALIKGAPSILKSI
jgi:hypothetical protein